MKILCDELFDWVGSGMVRVLKCTEYLLKDVGEAHKELESGKSVGKLILKMEE